MRMHKFTVSQGLSGKGNVSRKTSERIEKMAREMGYQPNTPAQRLATKASNNLVSLRAGTLDVGITTEKILLIQKELATQGYEVPIYTLSAGEGADIKSQQEQIRGLCRLQPRAIICSMHAFSPDIYDELRSYQKNGGVIVTYDLPTPLDCQLVLFDREDNTYRAARYLLERGHTKLSLALSSLYRVDGAINIAQNARLAGFARALEDFGLPIQDDWLFEVANYESDGASLAD